MTVEHPIFPKDPVLDLRVYARNGSHLVPAAALERLKKATHPSEAEMIFNELAPDVPAHDRQEVWLKCSDR